MRSWLLEFLKELESAIPPPPMCHHAITFAKYGSDEHGWQEKLALQINHGGLFHCFFLETDDFDKPINILVTEIVRGLSVDMPSAQISTTPLRYAP
jgi:hypothetical protein